MPAMDLETFAWLQSYDGQRLLDRARDLDGDALRRGEVLRKEASPERVAAALTQLDLRARAVAKFGDDAARMWFTPDGLEQSTRVAVANHRAARMALAAGTVIDLGCGIGGDLVAFARAGLTAAGVDLDPMRVAIARANLAALGLGGAAEVADATTVAHQGFDVAFADPARRGGRGRTFDPDAWTPPWTFVEELLARDSCVKTAPGLPHELIPEGVEAEWVSDHGEVKEAVLWSGSLASTRRRATVIGDGGLATLTDEDDPGLGGLDRLDQQRGLDQRVGVRDIGEFLYEPDGAVIRAGLVTAVAAGVSGGLLDEHIAYVTSDRSFHTPFARSYRVVEELPYREKQLRAALRERGVGRLTIKKRGVDVTPEALRKRLQLKGDAEATIVLTRAAGQGRCWSVVPF